MRAAISWGAERELGIGAALAVGGVERGAVPNGDQDVLEAVALAAVVVDVAGGNGRQLAAGGEAGQQAHPPGIAEDQIVLQLDRDVGRPEPLDVAVEEGGGLVAAVGIDQAGERALAAAGEEDEARAMLGQQLGSDAHRQPAVRFFIGHAIDWALVGGGDQLAEVGVTGGRFGEQGDVGAVAQRQLGPGDRLQAGALGGASELHRPVEPIMVRHRERGVAEGGRLERHLFGEGGAVQEGKSRVHVQFGVDGHALTGLSARSPPQCILAQMF